MGGNFYLCLAPRRYHASSCQRTKHFLTETIKATLYTIELPIVKDINYNLLVDSLIQVRGVCLRGLSQSSSLLNFIY